MQSDRQKTPLTPRQQETFRRLMRKGNLATLPMVAQKLIELSRDENSNFADFAEVIQSDQGLAARILRVANSAYYGLRIKATTLQRAITALGLKYVRSICLGFHLMSSMSRLEAQGFSMMDFWKISLMRAVLARQVAVRYCARCSEEAFLIGLLADCGIPFLVETLGEPYIRLWRDSLASQISLYRLEKKLFEVDHLAAITGLTDHWGMPEILAVPIVSHHEIPYQHTSNDELVQLSQIAYFCGNVNFNNPEKVTEVDFELNAFSQRVFGLDEQAMIKVFADVRSEYVCLMQLYQGIVPKKINVSELLAQAHQLLVEDVNQTQRHLVSVDEELRAYELAGQEEIDAETRGQYDPVTGLESRELLLKYLDMHCDRLKVSRGELSVVHLDIDNLRGLNRRAGVEAGDVLLKHLATNLAGILGESGRLFRVKGDEMVACVVGRPFEEVLKAVKLFLGSLQALTDPSGAVGVSVSVGLVHCSDGAHPGCGERLLELSDNQMYQAKLRGRNQVSYQIMGG